MRDVEQVFMDEMLKESYIRALTDDFSIVDLIARKESVIDDERGE